MNAKIICKHINEITTSHYTNDMTLELQEVDLREVEPKDIAKEYPYLVELFNEIIEYDNEILHDYLTKSGYVFNKA
jgi:hypothetical protein